MTIDFNRMLEKYGYYCADNGKFQREPQRVLIPLGVNNPDEEFVIALKSLKFKQIGNSQNKTNVTSSVKKG